MLHGAVRNFPQGREGALYLHLWIEAGFAGARGLADHFSPPFDLEDQFNTLFNLELAGMAPGWHTLRLTWDMAARTCRATVDDQPYAVLPLLRESPGPCYLRLRAHGKAGMMVETLDSEIA